MSFRGNEKLKVDQKWWNKGKPLLMKSTGLGAAMAEYAAAKDVAEKFSKKGVFGSQAERENSPIDAARDKLAAMVRTAKAAKVMADKGKHTATSAVLATVGELEKAELKALGQMESSFNQAYLTNVMKPLTQQLQQITKQYVDWKQSANDDMKAIEAELKWLGGTVKYSATLVKDDPSNTDEFKKLLNESAARFKKIETLQKQVEATQKKSEANINAAKGVVNDRRVADKDNAAVFHPMVNKINEFRNAITMYQNKSNLMLATATTQLQTIKSTFTGAQTQAADIVKVVEQVADALTGWGQDARRQNNNLTPWQAQLRQYVAAKQRAKGGKTVDEVAKEMGIKEPPAQWKKIADGFVKEAPRFMQKTAKLLTQSEALKGKALAQLTPSLRQDQKVKKHLATIDDKINEIRSYVQKNQDSFTELGKAAKALA